MICPPIIGNPVDQLMIILDLQMAILENLDQSLQILGLLDPCSAAADHLLEDHLAGDVSPWESMGFPQMAVTWYPCSSSIYRLGFSI